jgi:hypothetical protein
VIPVIWRRRIIRRPCYACRTIGPPLTSQRFCPACADIACVGGDGERTGLQVPTNVSAAVVTLESHSLACQIDRRACLVCALLALAGTCPEGGQNGNDHIKLGPRVVVGCLGYVTSAVRAAAQLTPPAAPRL